MTFKNIFIVLRDNLSPPRKIMELIGSFSINHPKRMFFSDFNKESLKDVDLVITIGGDGTFIRAANLVKDIPILGINHDADRSEGALTGLTIKDLDVLKDILSGNYEVSVRPRARVILNGKVLPEQPISEVYLGALSQFHSSRYKIKFQGREESQRSAGVIICTGTGSPAWFYSAGGEIFGPEEEKLSFIVREPYFGKRLFIPKILRGNLSRGNKITLESERNLGGILAINETTYDFNTGDVVEIELSEKPLNVLKPKSKNFKYS
jgi:NAD kinase